MAIGVCGTDLESTRWALRDGPAGSDPLVIGRESLVGVGEAHPRPRSVWVTRR